MRKTGTTVVFSTHDMGVAERMCDFIFMIYQGRKVLDGTLEAILDAAIRERRPALRAALLEGREELLAFKDIATLRDAGMDPPPDRETDWEGAAKAALELGMRKLAERLIESRA